MSTACGDIATGAARRRRERRLRSWLKHERMTVAVALAEASHHTDPWGQRTARARGWVRDEVHGHVPEAPTPSEPCTRYFSLDDNDSAPELGGSRSDRLSGVRPQERVPWRIVEQIVDSAPVLPLLHDPVPQMVDSVVEVLDSSSSRVGRWLPSRLGTVRSSRISKCPRFFSTRLRPAPLFLSRRRQNSW